MIYLYIDADGRVAQDEREPTSVDLESARDGQLTLVRVNADREVEQYDGGSDNWFDVDHAKIDKQPDDGREYHFCTLESEGLMYERFTDRARRVMQLANQEAQRFNHEYIGTEHVLLGLVKEGQGVACCVLKNLGENVQAIGEAVEKRLQHGPCMVTMGRLPQTPRVKEVIAAAIHEAKILKHNYIGTEHILLGLISTKVGVAADVLTDLITYDIVRLAIVETVGEIGTVDAPMCWTIRTSMPGSFDCEPDSVPLIGPPDGWPRTKDGHLVRPGITVQWIYPSDWHHHEADVESFRARVEAFLVEHYGERCHDFEPDCECCKRWSALDVLTENPFDKPKATEKGTE